MKCPLTGDSGSLETRGTFKEPLSLPCRLRMVLSGLTHILCIYLIFLCFTPFIFVMALLCGESPWNLTAVMWSGRRV